MNQRSVLLLALGLIIGIGVGFVAFRKPAVAPTVNTNSAIITNSTTNASNTNVFEDTNEGTVDTNAVVTNDTMVTVASPVPNARVSSPLRVTGEARGSWYFEGQFPLQLVDANGAVLARGTARATGNAQTTNFVPFTATLEFVDLPSTATGTLILQKDNPSGLPANNDSVRIPVTF